MVLESGSLNPKTSPFYESLIYLGISMTDKKDRFLDLLTTPSHAIRVTSTHRAHMLCVKNTLDDHAHTLRVFSCLNNAFVTF